MLLSLPPTPSSFMKTKPYHRGLNLNFYHPSPRHRRAGLTCCQRGYGTRQRIKHGVSLRRCIRGKFINRGCGKEVFLKWEGKKSVFKKTLTRHALSTHFNNRPSSQIVVLTPLISTDICSLSSLPPSCFFNQINPNGHPLMASFLGKLKEER